MAKWLSNVLQTNKWAHDTQPNAGYQMFDSHHTGQMTHSQMVIKWLTDRWHIIHSQMVIECLMDRHTDKLLSNIWLSNTKPNGYWMFYGQTLATWHAAKWLSKNVWQTDNTGQMTHSQMVIEFDTRQMTHHMQPNGYRMLEGQTHSSLLWLW